MSQSSAEQPDLPRPPRNIPESVRPSHGLRPGPLPRYRLVLHHQHETDLMLVVRSVMELTRFPRAEATYKMWEAHHSGQSVLFTTYLERAELYIEQFADKGLTVSLEPA